MSSIDETLGSLRLFIEEGKCAELSIGGKAQQYPGGIIGSEQVDPDIDDTAANEETNTEGGGVFKPMKTSPWESADSPREDGEDGRKQQRSGAEEMTPEQRRRSLQRPNNPCDALWDAQEVTRRADQPSSGKSVAQSGTVLRQEREQE
ncbi:hypothetical protein NDU88_005201 [Pleurodeles waltl]|uniref:Uncharacterized protein n=1 Tax=Pleurodeles waltl TaxID=8319 RepID=A0AAV7QI58_PLEWA|nr:hypothetical protein NDU88_005201 [Pleurodeles waltl]